MKFLVAYPVWNKADMIEWMLTGIAENLDPKRTEVVFYFDACVDESRNNFTRLCPKILNAKGFKVHYFYGDNEIYECGCHNKLIDYFMQETDADCLIIPQDDNRFQGKTLLDDLERLLNHCGNSIGYIGGRDAYDARYQNFISSPFSASDNAKAKLPIGEWTFRLSVNPGPLLYPRSTVTKIGKLDPAYHAWYWWDDYAIRANQAGLVNALLSMDCQHLKFGNVHPSVIYQDPKGWVAKDLALLNEKYAKNFNGNVI